MYPGNDLTWRFPLIVEALARLRSRSCIIDGEAVACDDHGMPRFDRIRYRRHYTTVFMYPFDLIELKWRRPPPQPARCQEGDARVGGREGRNWYPLQRAHRRRRGSDFPACLQAPARRHRVESEGLALPLWAVAQLAQVQKPGRACGEAGEEEDWGKEKWR